MPPPFQRIIIATSELSKDKWIIIYKFIKHSLNNTLQIETFDEICEFAGLRLTSSYLESDVYSLYGKNISFNDISSPTTTNYCFSIIYNKKDDSEDFTKKNNSEDFTELVPFVLLQEEFGNRIALGINLENISQQNDYIFKCSEFFILIDDAEPICGQKSLYFINEKIINKSTGEIRNVSKNGITSFRGKSDSSTYQGKSSRRFLPLLRISENNFSSIFGNSKEKAVESKELRFLKDSIEKINKDLKKKFRIQPEKSDSLIGEWLERSYLFSYEDDKPIYPNSIYYDNIRRTLQIYKRSIFELVQNIIFHGGKNGLIYFTFIKKGNLSKEDRDVIHKLDSYPDETRFLKIGIFDFNPTGIVETFKNTDKEKSSENILLQSFFDPNEFITTDITHLDLRYAARLGIKTFVKTVSDHFGSFTVQSCVVGKNNIKEQIRPNYDENDKVLFENENANNIFEFVNGTHYEIILPVIPHENIVKETYPLQTGSFFDYFKMILSSEKDIKDFQINSFEINGEYIKLINQSVDKEEQKQKIKIVSEEIVSKAPKDRNEIVIDLNNKDYEVNIIFKILAYLQLNSDEGFEKIILINAKDKFVDVFCEFIKNLLIDTGKPIWSNSAAIILISNSLRAQVVYGETKEKLWILNKVFEKYYFFDRENHFNEIINMKLNDFEPNINKIDIQAITKRFVLPYDMLSIAKDNNIYFESALIAMLKRKIISHKSGYQVNHKNTYIGSKIIIKNYYEADTVFQNNFFTERFAFLIANNIKKCGNIIKRQNKKIYADKKLVIIGYKNYSEYLVKTIKQLLSDVVTIHTVVIANEEKVGNTGVEKIVFNFDKIKDDTGVTVEEDIIKNPNDYLFITIVPIGSTLSTNDKIIAFFKLWFSQASQKQLSDESFIYNHCAIVVRDKLEKAPTQLESKEFNWKKINEAKKRITTSYRNAKDIFYTISIADDERKNNWKKRLNKEVSFPDEWEEEEYVNFTENSSINSQNLMGFPRVKVTSKEQHYNELDRLFELKDDIYTGHLEVHNTHHKYYIDTETFIKREDKKKFREWIREIAKKTVFDNEELNVLITPYTEIESDFINLINKAIFGGNALVIFLNINNWRNNLIHKLSFLKGLKNVSYHYIDHALLTGETYRKTKSYMNSIVKADDGTNDSESSDNFSFCFTSIITLINRMSYSKNQEIREEVNKNLFAFVNIHYPASKGPEQECEICKLERYYKDTLKRNTVLENCYEVIENNLKKIEKRSLGETIKLQSNKNEKEEKSIGNIMLSRMRKFIRFALTHELFYIISKIREEKGLKNFDEILDDVKEKLDEIYKQLCETTNKTEEDNLNLSSINHKIDTWFNCNLIEKKLRIMK